MGQRNCAGAAGVADVGAAGISGKAREIGNAVVEAPDQKCSVLS